MVEASWKAVHLDDCIAEGRPICYGILMPGQGYPGGVPVVKVKDIKGGRVLLDNILLTSPEIDGKYRRSTIRARDVLLTIRGTTGRVARVPTALDGANITQDTARVAPGTGVCSDFIFFALQSEDLQSQIRDHTRGQAVKGINIADVRRLRLLLPPPWEQRRIAAVLSSVDDAIDATQGIIDQLQVVKNAMMAELLTRGLPGRHTRFKQTETGEVPDAWEVVSLGSLTASGPDNGLYRPQSEYGEGVPILRIDSFDNGDRISHPKLRRVRAPADDVERFRLREADIIINRVNSLSHLAKAALVERLDEPTLFESNMMRLAVDAKRILPAFAFRVVVSQPAKAYFLNRAKQAVAQASINQQDVRALPVPLPSIDEQRLIADGFSRLDVRLDAETRMHGGLLIMKSTLMSVLLTGELRVTPDEGAS